MHGRTLVRRVALLTLVLLAGAAGAFVLAMVVHRKGLNWTADSATVAAFVVAVLPLLSPAFRRWWNGPAPVSQLSLDEAIERLFPVLLAQWSERSSDRQVHDPGAMRVQFKVTRFTRSLMRTVPSDRGPDSQAGIRPGDLSGSFDNILDIFRRVQRLVITGPAGSGKSVLAIKLACDLSAWQKARPRELAEIRLPVILQASTWKPRESLDQWIASELVSIDQELSRRPRGAVGKDITIAQAMAACRVIPIIDGIDELPRQRRAEAIRRINEAGSNRPLVVTSRPAEYSAALAAAGREISRAAVVAMQPLTLTAVLEYLREAATPRSLPRWRLVFEQLERAPEGPLAAALTNPLLLWLCRRVYSQGDRDPGELAGRPGLGHLRAIENHLLGAFVPAIYSSGGRPSPWTAAQARQWLGFLAGFMEQSRSSELAWWRLRTTVAGWRALSMIVRGAALSALACWLAMWVLRRAGDWRGGSYVGRAGFGKLLFSGPAAQAIRLAFDRLAAAPPSPGGPAPKAQKGVPPGSPLDFLRPVLHLLPWPLYVIILGTIALSFLSLKYAPSGPVTFRLAHGLTRTLAELVGLLLAAAAAIALFLHVLHLPPIDQGPVQRGLIWLAAILIAVGFLPETYSLAPTELAGSRNLVRVLRSDRIAYILAAAVLLVPLAAVWCICGTAIGVAAGVLGGTYLLSELAFGTSASGAFAETRTWLALTRRLPLRTLAFLEDAHQRGILARTGPTYQFRHLQLQRYLARGYAPLPHRLAQSRLGSLLVDLCPAIPSSTGAWARVLWAREFTAQAAALAGVVGRCEAAGPVYSEPPGVVQRFGTADGRDWAMCALPGHDPVLVEDSLWSLLHEVRADTGDGDALRLLGFPTLPAGTPAGERLIAPGMSRLTLDGGTWGPSALERSADRGDWCWRPHAQILLTERLSSRRRNNGARVDLKVMLPCAPPRPPLKRPLAQKLEERLIASDLVSVISALSPADRECPVTASPGGELRFHYWRAAIGSQPPATALLTVFSRLWGLEVRVRIDITAGERSGIGVRLGLPLEPLRAMLLAGWQAAVDVIPGAIVSDLPGSLTGRPGISLSLSAPSTPEEIFRLGPETDTRKVRRADRITVTERTIAISGSVVGLSKADSDQLSHDLLASMVPGFGYQVI